MGFYQVFGIHQRDSGITLKSSLGECDPNYLSRPKKIMKFILRVLSLFGE